ncbi:hypothetical protein L7F22_012452 [Adiantum nelumboides]|nr:hypothetical protein [Adiantum nelumboides]
MPPLEKERTPLQQLCPVVIAQFALDIEENLHTHSYLQQPIVNEIPCSAPFEAPHRRRLAASRSASHAGWMHNVEPREVTYSNYTLACLKATGPIRAGIHADDDTPTLQSPQQPKLVPSCTDNGKTSRPA